MKKFSLILNTRRRIQYLNQLIGNIHDTVSDINNVEIILGCDNDDVSTWRFLTDIITYEPSVQNVIKCLFIPRTKNLNDRLNQLANLAEGKYIWSINDDIEIITNKWDEVIYEQLEVIQHGIVYGLTQCNSIDHDPSVPYSSFPIISNLANKIAGKFHPSLCYSLGGEVMTWRVYDELGCTVQTDLTVKHLLHETLEQVYHPDQTAFEMRQNSNISQIDYLNTDITEHVNKLKQYIEGCNV